MLNKVQLIGHISGDMREVKKDGRPACLFNIDVLERNAVYTQSVILWDKAAEYALRFLAIGSLVLVEGKLTNRLVSAEGYPGLKILKTDVVAYSITGLGTLRDKTPNKARPEALAPTAGSPAPYPAAEPSEARTDAENGDDALAAAELEKDIKEKGLPA